MKFIQFTYGNKTMIRLETGTVCAEFRNIGEGGPLALAAFKNGLAHAGNVSLFDDDTGLYLIGTMDQLAKGRTDGKA